MNGDERADLATVRVLHSADGLALGEVGGQFVAIWRSGVTKPLFEWQRHCLAETLQRHPRGTGFMCVVEPTCKPPDDELRRASAEMISANEDRLRCVAMVIEGAGFRASITRAVGSGLLLLMPKRKVPAAGFSTVDEAAGWMAGHVPMASPAACVAGIARLRARMSAWDNA